MFITNIKRIIKTGFVNFCRNSIVSFSAIFVMMVTLAAILSLFLSSVLLDSALEQIKDKIDVNVYVTVTAPTDEIFKLKESLEILPEVDKVEYISREQALVNFKERHRNDSLTLQALEELDENYIEVLAKPRQKNEGNLFDDFESPNTERQWQTPKNTIRYKKVTTQAPPKPRPLVVPKNLKKIAENLSPNTNLFDTKLTVGNSVEHARFGIGKVVSLEGAGPNIKAEINFEKEGNKKLLLKFAKLKIIG